MSVCSPNYKKSEFDWNRKPPVCPALVLDRHWNCRMGLWVDGDGNDWPDTCQFAPILKLLAESERIEDLKVTEHEPESAGDIRYKNWSIVEFWIRREGER